MAGKIAVKIGRKPIAVSRPDKILYPAGKFTKANVVDYYLEIAPTILPHLRNRPITLKRFPDGVFGEAFYEKDHPAFAPDWIKTVPVPRRDPNEPPIQYILINDAATLAWAADAAALELHPFLHRVPKIDTPTHLVFDLDPGEGANILQCAEVAFLLQETLVKLRLKCFPKVSGSKGIQIYAPLNVPITYDDTQLSPAPLLSFSRAHIPIASSPTCRKRCDAEKCSSIGVKTPITKRPWRFIPCAPKAGIHTSPCPSLGMNLEAPSKTMTPTLFIGKLPAPSHASKNLATSSCPSSS